MHRFQAWFNKLLPLLVAALIYSRPGSAVAGCSAEIIKALKDEYSLSDGSSLASSAREALCNTSNGTYNRDAKFKVQVPVPQLKGIIGGDWGSSKAHDQRAKFCRDDSRWSDGKKAIRIARSLLSEKAVAALKSVCEPVGVACDEVATSPTTSRFLVSFHPKAGAPTPSVDGLPETQNLECVGAGKLAGKQLVPGEELELRCRLRDPTQGGFALVSTTTAGDVSCDIPPSENTFEAQISGCASGVQTDCQLVKSRQNEVVDACLLDASKMAEAAGESPIARQKAFVATHSCKQLPGLFAGLWLETVIQQSGAGLGGRPLASASDIRKSNLRQILQEAIRFGLIPL